MSLFKNNILISNMQAMDDAYCNSITPYSNMIYLESCLQLLLIAAFYFYRWYYSKRLTAYTYILMMIVCFKYMSTMLLAIVLLFCLNPPAYMDYIVQVYVSLDIVCKCFAVYFMVLIAFGLGTICELVERKYFIKSTAIMIAYYISYFVEEAGKVYGFKLVAFTVIFGYTAKELANMHTAVLHSMYTSRLMRVYDLYRNCWYTHNKVRFLTVVLVFYFITMVPLEGFKLYSINYIFVGNNSYTMKAYLIYQVVLDVQLLLALWLIILYFNSPYSNNILGLNINLLQKNTEIYKVIELKEKDFLQNEIYVMKFENSKGLANSRIGIGIQNCKFSESHGQEYSNQVFQDQDQYINLEHEVQAQDHEQNSQIYILDDN